MGPLPVYRRDSSNAQLAISGTATDTPDMVPCLGMETFEVVGRSPTDTFDVNVYGLQQANSTATLIGTMTCPAAGNLNQSIRVAGWEMLKITLVNGATAQKPEVLATLIPLRGEE